MIEVLQADIGYKKSSPVLRDVNLKIAAGEFWIFVGDNGSGKSTLIKSLYQRGLVHAGNLVTDPAREEIGYVPQGIKQELMYSLTVQEYLGLIPGQSRQQDPLKLLEHFELPLALDAQVGKLSGGQKQKLSIVRALLRKPKLLILDEPTNGLDLNSARSLFELLAKLIQDGMTLIVASHNQQLVYGYCSHVAHFYGGSVTTGLVGRELRDLSRELQDRLMASMGGEQGRV